MHFEEKPILAKTGADNLEEMEEIKVDEMEIKEDVGGEEDEGDEDDEEDEEDEEDETPKITLEIEKPNINLEIIDTATPSTNKNDVLSEDDLVDSILESMEPSNELTEFNIDLHLDNTSKDTMELKKPERVYYEMYQSVREKAKKAKQEAMLAYLEAKNIKKTYMLENLSDSSEDSMDDISDTGDE
jgi:nitric oxide reductase activation protein